MIGTTLGHCGTSARPQQEGVEICGLTRGDHLLAC